MSSDTSENAEHREEMRKTESGGGGGIPCGENTGVRDEFSPLETHGSSSHGQNE